METTWRRKREGEKKRKERKKRMKRKVKGLRRTCASWLLNWATVSHLWFQYLFNCLHSWRIWRLVSIGYCPQGHVNSSRGKNLRQYSPVGVWLTMALEALMHSELEWPKYFSHEPPLKYVSSMIFESSSRSSKKFLPLASEAWNVIFQVLRISSHLVFQLNCYEDLHGKIGMRLNSLSTMLCKNHLSWLGHSQNSMELW